MDNNKIKLEKVLIFGTNQFIFIIMMTLALAFGDIHYMYVII